MKPPSRQRHLPLRLSVLNKTESRKNLVASWHYQDIKKLLRALKEHNKLKKLDVLDLRKKVPKHSLPEICFMIKTLKKQVECRVYQQVQKQRQEKLKIKVPIEIWAELAQRMAGAHVETLTSVFFQILVIAAAEPCSLLNSDPPRSLNTSDVVDSNLKTKSMMPLCMLTTMTSPVMIRPVQTPSTQTTEIMTLKPQPLMPHCVPDRDLIKPSTQRTPMSPANSKKQSVLKSVPLVSTLKTVSNAPGLPILSSNQLVNHRETGQYNQDSVSKSMCIQYVVDFEKIYRFLASINNKPTLTAMESALVLDLLMSLPEELPLLDCKELQHHLLHEYTHLKTKPINYQIPSVDHPATSQTQSEQPVQKSNLEGRTEQTHNAALQKKDDNDWAAVGFCPLNPFMVPLTLLKRQ